MSAPARLGLILLLVAYAFFTGWLVGAHAATLGSCWGCMHGCTSEQNDRICGVTPAAAHDYWTTCKEAYDFCARRPFYRDCSIWTSYGKELTNGTPNPMYGKDPSESPHEECRANPGNPACPNPGDPYLYENCPIPEKYQRSK